MQSEMPAPGSYEPFRLKEKIGEMMKYGRPLTKNFSRKDRDLADDMRVSMLKMYHLAVELEKKYYRKTTAQELDVELEWLRNLVRMAATKTFAVRSLPRRCPRTSTKHGQGTIQKSAACWASILPA